MKQWIIVQLTPWAVKTKSTKELHDTVKRHSALKKLDFFYPTTEDEHGKYDVGFGEYAFLEFKENVDYSVIENTEDFSYVLRASDRPEVVSDQHVQEIRQKVRVFSAAQPDDVVKITAGALAGNLARVLSVEDQCALLEVDLGQETITAALSLNWLKVIRSMGDGRL